MTAKNRTLKKALALGKISRSKKSMGLLGLKCRFEIVKKATMAFLLDECMGLGHSCNSQPAQKKVNLKECSGFRKLSKTPFETHQTHIFRACNVRP